MADGRRERTSSDIADLWDPKYRVRRADKVITAGSCFAQHIGKALTSEGFGWLDAEPAPPGIPEELARAYNYGIFSFRTQNIYTAALLRQWMSWAVGEVQPPTELWYENGRVYDPFRPTVEPRGFEDEGELLAARDQTLRAIRSAFEQAQVFVFTLGLTEAWMHESDEEHYAYPTCPGTTHGEFDPAVHHFKNLTYPEIFRDLNAAIDMARGINPELKVILTVSPVPLTATADETHILVSNTYSKSVLRAVAGDLAKHPHIDYFPSYEIITGAPYRSMFYEPNLRSVSPFGVAHVMQHFFKAIGESHGGEPGRASGLAEDVSRNAGVSNADHDDNEDDQVVCEDVLLEAFAPNRN